MTKKQLEAGFVFALTNPGSEKALKLEVEMIRPEWRFSYQRRGFVTFKSEAFTLDSLEVPLACARRFCLSLGKSATREEAESKAREHADLIQHARFFERKMEGVQNGGAMPGFGDLVGTVVELGAEEFWSGVHRHGPFLSPHPAGDPGIVMPADSPSRAWLKLEEAARFFGLEFRKDGAVVELGCAPGGVVLALLNRGVPVIGVDPAKMAEVVTPWTIAERADAPAGKAWFFHCRKPAALVAKRDLGTGVGWFMSDMNQTPEVVIKELGRFMKMCPSIRGALVTLKLADMSDVARKSEWFASLRDLGFREMRLQQLAAHHRELVLLARM